MTGKQQQNKADDNKQKNNVLNFFHVHKSPDLPDKHHHILFLIDSFLSEVS